MTSLARTTATFSLTVLFGFTSATSAQDPGITPKLSPGPSPDQMTAYMGHMFDGLLDYLAKPETAEKAAKMTKNCVDALVKEGFSREEALRIVTAPGFLHLTSK